MSLRGLPFRPWQSIIFSQWFFRDLNFRSDYYIETASNVKCQKILAKSSYIITAATRRNRQIKKIFKRIFLFGFC